MNDRSAQSIAREVRDFWFGGEPGEVRKEWFTKNDAFDAEIRRKFENDVILAAKDRLDGLKDTSEGCIALCILLDQFPRNIWRGAPRAFAMDGKALAVARHAVDTGLDKPATKVERQFLYLPFEHSESLADQEKSVRLFQALENEWWLDYAVRHRDIIARFGRFPHRNDLLGRQSTPEEVEFLKQPNSSF